MTDEFVPTQLDESANLVNRQIRVIVKTMSSGKTIPNQLPLHTNNYQPSVAIVNLNKYFHKIGLPVPRSYCSHLWVVKDCGGYCGAGFTWFFIFAGETLVILNLLARPVTIFTTVNGGLSLWFAFLGFVGHCRAMFTDPGAVPRGDATQENISKMKLIDGQVIYRCPKCDCIKPDRAHHCSTCQRCVRKMDHHCPWINNCVGENNQKFFLLFTFYISVISWHALFISIYTLIMCTIDNFKECTYSPTFSLVCMILLTVEGMMFGLFTCIMCCSQLSAICSDQTGIEQLKKERRKKKSCMMNIREVLGQKFSYKWFSPFHTTIDFTRPDPFNMYADL